MNVLYINIAQTIQMIVEKRAQQRGGREMALFLIVTFVRSGIAMFMSTPAAILTLSSSHGFDGGLSSCSSIDGQTFTECSQRSHSCPL